MIQSGQEKILLTVGCIDTLNTTVMYPFYSQVLKEKNQINLRLRTHQSSELYGLLEKHEIDIGFVYHHLHYKNVVATPVLREKMYLVQREEYALRKSGFTPMRWTRERNCFLVGIPTIRSGMTNLSISLPIHAFKWILLC